MTRGLKRLLQNRPINEKLNSNNFACIGYFFPKTDNWKDLRTTPVATWSMMTPNMNDELHQLIEEIAHKPIEELTITDATACTGGSAIGFALKAKHTNMVEVNEELFALLINNIKLFNINSHTLYNANYNNIYDILSQDIIFIDPPWGGLEYETKPQPITMSGVNIIDFMKQVKPYATIVIARVPYNYNPSKCSTEYVVKVSIYKKYKYIVMT